MPGDLSDAVYQSVDDELDWWFEQGPIEWGRVAMESCVWYALVGTRSESWTRRNGQRDRAARVT